MTSCYNSVVHMLTLMCAILWQIILVNPCLLSKYYIELVSTVLYHLTHVFQMMSQDKNILLSKNKGKGTLPKKREYIKTFDLKDGGGQFENLII